MTHQELTVTIKEEEADTVHVIKQVTVANIAGEKELKLPQWLTRKGGLPVISIITDCSSSWRASKNEKGFPMQWVNVSLAYTKLSVPWTAVHSGGPLVATMLLSRLISLEIHLVLPKL